MWSVTTMPSTASPRNSSRSFDAPWGCSARQDGCERAWRRTPRSRKLHPSRDSKASRASASMRPDRGSGRGRSQPRDHVVHRVAHRLQVAEVLVVDGEADGALAQIILERLDQLDEGELVGVEVVGEGRVLGDGVVVDLENLREVPADHRDDLV